MTPFFSIVPFIICSSGLLFHPLLLPVLEEFSSKLLNAFVESLKDTKDIQIIRTFVFQ